MKLVALTGAGMSAESGLKTFRDHDGLWENHSIYEVATPEAWQNNPKLVLEFYNQRRSQLQEAEPNHGHEMLAAWEKQLSVQIITQNVDNLHERAGSTHVLHLHGELTKIRCSADNQHVTDIGYLPLSVGDLCPDHHPMRPHIVWFGEDVPMIPVAAKMVSQADALLIIGTSMQVYPAAGLVSYASIDCPIYFINPQIDMPLDPNIHVINKKAIAGLSVFQSEILPDLLEGYLQN